MTSASAHSANWRKVLGIWSELVSRHATCSPHFAGALGSEHKEVLLSQMLSRMADTTLLRYLRSVMDFRELLVQGRVPPAVADALVTAGLNLELFGTVAVSVDALETELARWVDAELLESEAVVMLALRLLFLKHAHPGLLPGHPAPALQTGSSLPAAPSTSWTETFAPKLDAATISALKSAFEISYPSESNRILCCTRQVVWTLQTMLYSISCRCLWTLEAWSPPTRCSLL